MDQLLTGHRPFHTLRDTGAWAMTSDASMRSLFALKFVGWPPLRIRHTGQLQINIPSFLRKL